ncbi:MAG: alpha/beta hydrolase [Sandaracinus sp.]|nr:alpha/beta hydrolase [Sandaracinus sp.]MCB9631432.1 alpha/beta hydrolase [Sandaracinus sp.]
MTVTPLVTPRPQNSTNGRLSLALRGLRLLAAASPQLTGAAAERLFLSTRRRPRPAVEHEAIERARAFVVTVDGQELPAWEWGRSGPRVLLVHGWEGRGAQLAPLAEALVEHGFRAVAFDAPGHGDAPGSRSSFFEVAATVRGVAESLGELHAIVAHSMGGAATAWASRDRALATRYVMIAPPADLRDFTRGFTRMLGLPREVGSVLEARLERRFGVPLADVAAERSVAHRHEPLLVVHDTKDREVPFSRGELLAKSWPGARLAATHGLGHQRILRDDAVIAQVVRFVQGA